MDNIEEGKYQVSDISATILEHMMNPKNYGEIKNPTCAGIALDEKTGEFVLMYLDLKDGKIEDIKFSTNCCQDTIVAGSLFTEMVIGDTLKNGIRSSLLMAQKIEDAPPQQKACTQIVLLSFDASIENLKNRTSGIEEEFYTIKVSDSCEAGNLEQKDNISE